MKILVASAEGRLCKWSLDEILGHTPTIMHLSQLVKIPRIRWWTMTQKWQSLTNLNPKLYHGGNIDFL